MNEYIKTDFSWLEEYIPEGDPREDEIYMWEEDDEEIVFVPKYIWEEIMGKSIIITLN